MSQDALIKILDKARWAPSGDNTQPWRFEITSATSLRVAGFDTRDEVLYDFDGHASHMAHGALLETIRIAATEFQMRASWTIQSHSDDRVPVYDVAFEVIPGLPPDPLVEVVESRVVQRRPMSTKPLNETQRGALRLAVGDGFELRFYESFSDRIRVAKLLWNSAYLRLTCPEAYLVHKSIIEWGARYSKDRIPEQAVGVDYLTARLMKWVMQSWSRVDFFNRYLMGTVLPRLQLDVLPALRCASHLLIAPKIQPSSLSEWLQLGGSMQRLWLTATSLGLHMQPEMTPVIFRWYARNGKPFSAEASLNSKAVELAGEFEMLCGAAPTDSFGFFARIGESKAPTSRSTRHDLGFLMGSASIKH